MGIGIILYPKPYRPAILNPENSCTHDQKTADLYGPSILVRYAYNVKGGLLTEGLQYCQES